MSRSTTSFNKLLFNSIGYLNDYTFQNYFAYLRTIIFKRSSSLEIWQFLLLCSLIVVIGFQVFCRNPEFPSINYLLDTTRRVQ